MIYERTIRYEVALDDRVATITLDRPDVLTRRPADVRGDSATYGTS